MSKEIEYQGITYKVNDDVTLNKLLQSKNFQTIHEGKMRDKTYGLLRSAGVDVEKQLEDEANKSGFVTSLPALIGPVAPPTKTLETAICDLAYSSDCGS